MSAHKDGYTKHSVDVYGVEDGVERVIVPEVSRFALQGIDS
jgi:hypothetical protein